MTEVRFAALALRDAERIDVWWRDHRPSADERFAEELREAVALLRSAPTIGSRYDAPTRVPTRRLLLPDTQVHLYYRLESDRVVVLRLWGARRQRGPSLR